MGDMANDGNPGGDRAGRGSNRADRPPLTQSTIVAAAISIADNEGVAKLSMRHLARSLGYEVMSLYNHVANKNDLLGLMLEAVAEEIEYERNLEPMAAVRALAIATHDVFLNHRWMPEQWLQHLPGPARTQSMEDLLRLLDASGLNSELAHFGFHAVNNHVLGHTMQQIGMTVGLDDPERVMNDFVAGLSDDEHPHMIKHVKQHIDGENGDSFELVLDLILDGLVRMNDES